MSQRTRLLLSAALAASSAAVGAWSYGAGVADGPAGGTVLTAGGPQAAAATSGSDSPFSLGLQPIYAQAGTVPPGTTVPAAPAAPGPASERPLMTLLGQTPAGDFLHRTGINVYGWIEGSYTKNFDTPPTILRAFGRITDTRHLGRLNIGRQFDIDDNDFLVNQLDLTVERKADLTSGRFEVGGRIDLLYGSDARFIHANGMFDDVGFGIGPQYEFDLPQLYVDLGIPVDDGHALRLRVGKFAFFKPTDPNASAFYSHTILYATGGQDSSQSRQSGLVTGSALPFTLTGVSGFYSFNSRLSAEAGFSRGHDQSLSDDNGAIDAFGRVNYAFSNRTKLSFALITGPESNHDNSHYRTTGDLSLVHSVNDNLALLFDAVYGVQARPSSFTAPPLSLIAPVGTPIGGDAHWYGISGNAIYRINDKLSVAGRLEWYRDEQGFTTGLPQSLYEATVGLTITPFPDSDAGSGFKVRPEVRLDYSDGRYFSLFTRHHQWTAAVDAIYNF